MWLEPLSAISRLLLHYRLRLELDLFTAIDAHWPFGCMSGRLSLLLLVCAHILSMAFRMLFLWKSIRYWAWGIFLPSSSSFLSLLAFSLSRSLSTSFFSMRDEFASFSVLKHVHHSVASTTLKFVKSISERDKWSISQFIICLLLLFLGSVLLATHLIVSTSRLVMFEIRRLIVTNGTPIGWI